MSRLVSLLLVCCFAVFSSACSEKGDSTPDAGSAPDAGETGDGGEETPDAGDGKCRSDLQCPVNQYCQLSTGECLDAKACGTTAHCEYQESGESDYCDFGGCYCDTERNGGSCRPRVRLCESCTRDIECGNDPFIYQDYSATCRDFGGEKVCLATRESPCPPAYVTSQDGTHCVPAGGSCDAQAPCARDSDCDPYSDKPICNVAGGFCTQACSFDFSTGDSSCPPSQVCHVDPRLLKADNPNFGGGKCGLPCNAAEDAFVCGAGTSCELDGDSALVSPLVSRCRPAAPSCVRDADCPTSPETNSNGYCDRSSLTCSTGCRRESDCSAGYKCSENQCVQKTCVENGGANISCQFGAFCCGEPGSVDPCPTGVSYGSCYPAPETSWCASCATPGPNLTNTPTPMSTRPQLSQCVPIEGSPQGNVQMLFHSCDPTSVEGRAACPRGWQCSEFLQFCQGDGDCGASGSCVDVEVEGIGKMKACSCSNGESCPSPSTCMQDENGAGTFCGAYWCDNLRNCFAE